MNNCSKEGADNGTILALALTMFAVVTTTGCGKTDKQKDTDEFNQKSSHVNDQHFYLTLTYGVNIMSDNTKPNTKASFLAKNYPWASRSDKELADIEARLRDCVGNLNDILALMAKGNVDVTNKGYSREEARSNANVWLQEVLAYRKSKK